jgi:hypothetical protein
MAGLGTTTVGNRVLAGCELPTWSIMSTVSTIVPTTTSVPPPHETCRLHILEASQNYDQPLNVELNVTAGDNAPTTSRDFAMQWGDSAAILRNATRLPYDVTAEFLLLSSDNNFEDWPITLTAGSTRWTNNQTDSSQLPYCKVGGWDNGNSQDAFNSFKFGTNYVSVSFLGDDEHNMYVHDT